MRRRLGRGRSGPGLFGTVARTAVIAGTAQAVAGRVAAGQHAATQPAATHSEPARTVDDLHTQLLKLAELQRAGLLTDDEFAQQKARLLAP